MNYFYAGIGSRMAPIPVLEAAHAVASDLAKVGYTLRSGRAIGLDLAFERGALDNRGRTEIFVAADAVGRDDWHEHASRHHPIWRLCSTHAKLLHARNSAIILGADLNKPVDFVLCWTKDGTATGGTGQGIRVAQAAGVPIFNMFNADDNVRFWKMLVGWGLVRS